MSSILSSHSGRLDLPKPGCDGTISRCCAANRATNSWRGSKPCPPCSQKSGAPSPESNNSRSTPAIFIVVLVKDRGAIAIHRSRRGCPAIVSHTARTPRKLSPWTCSPLPLRLRSDSCRQRVPRLRNALLLKIFRAVRHFSFELGVFVLERQIPLVGVGPEPVLIGICRDRGVRVFAPFFTLRMYML